MESLELPEFVSPLQLPSAKDPELEKLLPETPRESMEPVQVVKSDVLNQRPDPQNRSEIGEYTVLGERIDEELKGKIYEAIMHTRQASGGTNQPWVTRSVFKASSYCLTIMHI